jgi:hypothetical protein
MMATTTTMAMGGNNDGDGATGKTSMATTRWRRPTTTTLATGGDGDGDGATGDTSMATARRATKTTMMAAVDQ